jgi:hypothetical protein
MARTLACCIAIVLVAAIGRADEAPPAPAAPANGDKVLSGMSIVGNDEAPKSLVIVPWKSSGLGDALDVGTSLGDGRDPVDKDVFMRELGYYQIRAASPGAGSSGAR